MTILERSNPTLVEAPFPLSFEDFVSQQIDYIAKCAYEQSVTRNQNIVIASYQCLEAKSIETDDDGNVLSINNAKWETRISCADLDSYRQHLLNFYAPQERIDYHTDIAKRLLELLDPDRQCLLYLQQGIFLPEHYVHHLDEQIVTKVVEFPVSLSSWYQSSFVTPTRKQRQQL